MAKYANAGELRTPCYFKCMQRTMDSEGYPCEEEVNIFGENVAVPVKWVNAHGNEVFETMQLEIKEPATITCRYSPLINARCLIYKKEDTDPYEIISIDNVDERSVWLEIKVQRKEAAR